MDTEYYILKPSDKEAYHLGTHISYLRGIPCNEKVDVIDYVTHKELMVELFWYYEDCNWLTIQQLNDIALDIFEWCNNSAVVMSNYIPNDYRQTGSIRSVYEEFKFKYNNLYTLQEELEEVICSLIPCKYYIKDSDNVIQTIATLVNFIKERR